MSTLIDTTHLSNPGPVESKPLSRLAQISRVLFLVTAIVFALCVTAQVFIAGMAVFAGPQNWALHTNFIHFFEFLPILMLLFAFMGRLPGRIKWASGAFILLIFYMYFAANIRGVYPIVAATHPVVAFVIWGLAIWTSLQAWRVIARSGS